MFQCDRCGECCRHLNLSPIYAPLHDGDGICRHLRGSLCGIYKDRPLPCRIDDSYDAVFSMTMSREEFYRLNKEMCEKFQKERRRSR